MFYLYRDFGKYWVVGQLMTDPWKRLEKFHCKYLNRGNLCKTKRTLKNRVFKRSKEHLAPRSWFVIPFSNKKNQGSSEKWLILGLGQEIHKLSLDHLVVPESKEALRTWKVERVQRTQDPTWKSSHWPNLEKLEQQDKSCSILLWSSYKIM